MTETFHIDLHLRVRELVRCNNIVLSAGKAEE